MRHAFTAVVRPSFLVKNEDIFILAVVKVMELTPIL